MNRTTLRLVLIVSCAHALVHIFELALPSVEMGIADDYGIGTHMTGLLSTCWRLPWGIGALGAVTGPSKNAAAAVTSVIGNSSPSGM